MNIETSSRAGSMESNDIFVMLHPSDQGIQIDLESKVYLQYGSQIRTLILKTLEEEGVQGVHLVARDSGALDYTIKSRVKTAVSRAKKAGKPYE